MNPDDLYQSLQAEYDGIGKKQSKTTTELTYAEVTSYSKKDLKKELQKKQQHHRQQGKVKRREEEI